MLIGKRAVYSGRVQGVGFRYTARSLADTLQTVADGVVNRNTAKALLPRLRGTDVDPETLVRSEGLAQVSDRGALEAAVRDVVAKNPEQVAQFRAGKDKVMSFFVGQIMKATGGKANAQLVQELLRAALREIA